MDVDVSFHDEAKGDTAHHSGLSQARKAVEQTKFIYNLPGLGLKEDLQIIFRVCLAILGVWH